MRTLHTEAQLQGLSVNAIILDARDELWRKTVRTDNIETSRWMREGSSEIGHSTSEIVLPARVLHTPEMETGSSGRLVGHPFDLTNDVEHRARWDAYQHSHRETAPSRYREGPLHVIVGERQTGKTHLAQEWLLSAPDGVERVLVTHSLDAAKILRERLGLTQSDTRVVSFHSLVGPGRSARAGVEYGFDDTVLILERLLRLKETPHLVTVTVAPKWQGGA